MMAFTNLSLKKKMAIVILAGAMLGLGVFSWLGIRSVNESVKRTLDERLMIARIIASYVDENIAHAVLHLQNAADFGGNFPSKGEFERVAATLHSRLAESGIQIQKVILLDLDGKVTQVEPESPSLIGIDLSGQSEVAETLRTGQATISGLLSSPITKVPVVLVSVPILNQNSVILGALTISMGTEQSTISTFSQAITVGQTGYAEIVDGNGIVLARTRPASPPAEFEQSDHPGKLAELIARDEETVSVCHRCHETPASLERRRDIIAFAPLSNASWGVAIRQAEEEALAPAMQLRKQLLLLGLVIIAITFFTAWIMVLRIVKPINSLTAAMKRVAGGDFRAMTPVKRHDEIGQLNSAFYSMTQDLAKSRNELSKSRDELMLRNRELLSLNSIASAVNQSLNLEKVLDAAMRQIHELAGTTAGCVFLCGSTGNTLQIVTGVGFPGAFQCGESSSPSASCACHQVLRHGQTLMVNSVSQCPLLGKNTETKGELGYFVSVPLKARDKTLGVMNIAGPDKHPFTENDFRILDSIASHIGLAIENSSLYEDAKQKEQIRGQLLSGVINAQEEERKRIARELHDEYGQSLTALKVSIESMDNLLSPSQSELRKKLKSAADLVVNTLEDLRRLTLALRPYALDELGLTSAIRAHTQRHLEVLGINVKLETKGLNRRLTPQVETSVFRIVQEAIHNVIKHANAHNVTILLAAQDGKIDITVEDDGTGFDVDATLKSKVGTQSLGLLGIQERANLLGGKFDIKSQRGQGTRLFVEIPITGSHTQSSPGKEDR